jgi:ubiquinol-cytochrome c reductase cytochrome b subunit
VVALLVWHIFLFRRHGITAKDPKRKPDEYFWPDQVLNDAVACLAVLATVLFLVLRPWLFHTGGDLGAELAAPADPSETYSAARPEWYFLFLFEFLKFFPGGTEIWGAIIIPGFILLVIFLMPIIGRWKLGHRFNVGLSCSLLAGIIFLTFLALTHDRRDPAYKTAVEEARRNAERVKALARANGIPREGAITLLRNDPLTQGPKLFAKNCASCHRYDGHDGTGTIPSTTHEVKQNETLDEIAKRFRMTEESLIRLNNLKAGRVIAGQKLRVYDLPSASDLKGFARREWLAGLLDPSRIDGLNYFGGTKFKDGKMARFVKKDIAALSAEQKTQLQKVIAALSAEAALKSRQEADRRDTAMIAEGKTLIASDALRCTECHQFYKPDEDATAPDLTGYGSRDWLVAFVSNPAHPRFFGKRNDRMPAFAEDKILDDQAISLITDWLRGEWYEPDR